MLDAFVFDIGNVLLPFDFGVAIRRVAGHCRVSPEAMYDKVAPIKDEYECGRMDRATFVGRAMEALGYDGARSEFEAAWVDIFRENEAMHALVGELAKRYPLYLLSNTSDLHLEHVRAEYDIFRHFRGGVFSHEAGCMKPSPEIYRKVIQAFALEPGRVLFIDDLEENVVAARCEGFLGYHYHPDAHGGLEEELRERYGLVV
jgi:putative hydrolase of the HAD superfamily